MALKAKPDGYNTVTAYLVVKDCKKAIEFYKKALGAEPRECMEGPDGKVMHAEISLGDSRIMLSDENPAWDAPSPQTLGGTPVSLFVYCDDVDRAFERAIKAGCTATMPPSDMFWGDRYGKLVDPYGHKWAMATHKEDVSPAEMQKRAEAFARQMAAGGGPKKQQ